MRDELYLECLLLFNNCGAQFLAEVMASLEPAAKSATGEHGRVGSVARLKLGLTSIKL